MNYRNSNFPSYYDNPNPRLGYSNVSKGLGHSNRSISAFIQSRMQRSTTWARWSSCCRTSAENLERRKRSTSTTWTTSASWESSLRTNWSNSKMNSAAKMSRLQNWSSKSTICYIKIRICLSRTIVSSISWAGFSKFTVERSMSWRHNWRWRRRTSRKPRCITIASSKNSKKKDSNTYSSSPLSSNENSRTQSRNANHYKARAR